MHPNSITPRLLRVIFIGAMVIAFASVFLGVAGYLKIETASHAALAASALGFVAAAVLLLAYPAWRHPPH
jgi:hypothetical protein